jgi:glycosyltransferase involved in cell wall biosynthesis
MDERKGAPDEAAGGPLRGSPAAEPDGRPRRRPGTRERNEVDATVIVPARNAAGTLGATLAALAQQDTAAAFEVLVVDDGSDDATAAIAEAAGATVVRGDGHGPAAARNAGAAAARGAALAFTDADCVPERGWLAAGLAALGTAELVQGRVLPPDGAAIGPYDRFIWVDGEHGLYETANLLVRRELFERLGGFESVLVPRRGIELGEDVWLGWRARRAGAATTFAADALVRHAVFFRGPGAYVAERARLRFFPELAARIPELRDGFLHRRVFLSPRSARFDLAAAGVLGAMATRRPIALLAALPYACALRAARPRAALVEIAADAVGAAALLYGSVRTRSPVL